MTANFKVVVPNEIQIGCHKYSILFDKALTDANVYGRRNPMLLSIRLSPDNQPSQNLVSLLHEFLHCISDHYCSDKVDEGLIDGLAEGLAQIVQNMGIELDFSNIKHLIYPTTE